MLVSSLRTSIVHFRREFDRLHILLWRTTQTSCSALASANVSAVLLSVVHKASGNILSLMNLMSVPRYCTTVMNRKAVHDVRGDVSQLPCRGFIRNGRYLDNSEAQSHRTSLKHTSRACKASKCPVLNFQQFHLSAESKKLYVCVVNYVRRSGFTWVNWQSGVLIWIPSTAVL